MIAFIIKRFFSGIVTLLLLITITFCLIRLMPGSPFQNNAISQNTLEMLEDQYQLNQPIWIQYKTFLLNLLQGDLGISYKQSGVTVAEILMRALPNTMRLGLWAVVVSLIAGILIGVLQATMQNQILQSGISAFIAVSISIPNFAVALFLLLIFGVRLRLFPIVGLMNSMSYVLPIVTLSLYPMAMIAKTMRISYGEAMQKECVTMAKAKGLPRYVIVFRHTLKQALIPVISMMGPTISFLLTGSFVVESIFSIPGLGMEFVHSINNRDYTVILGLVIFMGIVVISVHTITDIICSILDTRRAVLYS